MLLLQELALYADEVCMGLMRSARASSAYTVGDNRRTPTAPLRCSPKAPTCLQSQLWAVAAFAALAASALHPEVSLGRILATLSPRHVEGAHEVVRRAEQTRRGK